MNNTNSISKLKLILCLAPAFSIVFVFIIIVLYIIIAQSVGFYNLIGNSNFSLEHWNVVLHSNTTWTFFFYSFRQGMLASICSIIVAYPFALWLYRPFVGSALMTNLLRIPMLIPGLVAAFLFVNIISYHGLVNELLVKLHIISKPLQMQNDSWGLGVLILQIWKNTPFAVLLLSATMKNISFEIFDAARDLGANKFTLIWKIFLPLSLSSMRAAMILIFIGALGDFSFNSVAGPRSLQSLSQYIVTLTQQFFEANQAAVVTIMLMIASLIGVCILVLITKTLEIVSRK